MENEFIQKTMQICTYQLKADTKTSYYWKGGSQILPNRISVKDDLFSPIKKSSNTLHPTIGEFKAQFTHKEQSKSSLMRNKPYQVHTRENFISRAIYRVCFCCLQKVGKEESPSSPIYKDTQKSRPSPIYRLWNLRHIR